MNFNSKKYWIERYEMNGGNSGVGSYGIYAQYKADIINNFFIENNIKTVLEMGCGDGNQLSLLKPIKYYGYDISKLIINENIKRYKNLNYVFSSNIDDFISMKYDVTLSLDVIFHLIEDSVYHDHIKTLFELSKKYVIIYSPNINKNINIHVKYRKFNNNVPNNFKLIKKIINPHKGDKTQSDFYFYKKE